jgi:hypothetical protein
VPWSIFQQGGGPGAALTWARALLAKIGAPQSIQNQQFIFDWETSEGGGGAFNPLNQGDVPGQPQLTTTGSQFGGGAADFAGWNAGLQGAADYLKMPAFATIADDLRANKAADARTALISSPWAASHYGGGSAFSDAPVPGRASALAPAGASKGTGLNLNPLDGFGIPGSITSALGTGIKELVFIGIALAGGSGLIIVGLVHATGVGKHAPGIEIGAPPA